MTIDEKFPVSRRRYILEIILPPIIWGLGASCLAVIGFLDIDIILAFGIGFCVGLVHDLVLVALRVISYKPRIQYLAYDAKYSNAVKLYEAGDWKTSLEIFLDLIETVPNEVNLLYFIIRCYDKLGDSQQVVHYCERYLELDPNNEEIIDRLQQAQP